MVGGVSYIRASYIGYNEYTQCHRVRHCHEKQAYTAMVVWAPPRERGVYRHGYVDTATRNKVGSDLYEGEVRALDRVFE